MADEIITTDAPLARSAYSQGMRSGNVLFTSGFIATAVDGSGLIRGDFDAEVRQALRNALAVVEAAGGSAADVVRINVSLTDLANFDRMDQAVRELFRPPYPSRNTIGVKELWGGALVGIDLVAVVRD